MPRGVRNTPKPPAVAPADGPAPLIIIQPGPDGLEFNAYGLDLPEVIDTLRRALIYLVASQAGAHTIPHTIRRNGHIQHDDRLQWIGRAAFEDLRRVDRLNVLSNGASPVRLGSRRLRGPLRELGRRRRSRRRGRCRRCWRRRHRATNHREGDNGRKDPKRLSGGRNRAAHAATLPAGGTDRPADPALRCLRSADRGPRASCAPPRARSSGHWPRSRSRRRHGPCRARC